MEERPCSPTESLIISLKQVKDIKNGKIPRKTWEQLLEEEENTSLEYTINTTPKFDEDIKYYKRKNILIYLKILLQLLKNLKKVSLKEILYLISNWILNNIRIKLELLIQTQM